MLKRLKWLLFLVVFFSLQRFCHRATEGFSPQKIQASSALFVNETPPLPALALDADVEELLSQPFYYLGRGAQVYAFASADGTTVIKFFRHHRMNTLLHPLARFLPASIQKRSYAAVEKRRLKILRDFQSYAWAFDRLKEETGLLYLRLNRSIPLKKQLTLYDKIGVKHLLDLNHLEFIVQKRALPFYETLGRWIDQGDHIQCTQALTELVHLLEKRCKQGLSDKDPDLKTNFGFLEGHPIQIDGGRFKEDSSKTDPDVFKPELMRITDALSHWLAEKKPELALYLKEEIDRL